MSSRDALQPRVVTIVMYHVVHSNASGASGRLKGIDVAAFRGQLAYIRRQYTPVPLSDLAAAAAGATELPPRPIVLSFDDGYAAHFTGGVSAACRFGVSRPSFPVASALIDRGSLNVNKVQTSWRRIRMVVPTRGANRGRDRRAPGASATRRVPAGSGGRRRAGIRRKSSTSNACCSMRSPEGMPRPLVDELFRSLIVRGRASIRR